MGWTGYTGMTAEQAVRHELRGNDILAKSGAWWLVQLNHGKVTLVHALTQRHSGEVMVKLVDVSMGPVGTPPRNIFHRWLKLSATQTRGQYERDFIDRVTEEHMLLSSQQSIKPGDHFSVALEWTFSDGVTEKMFIYEGKYVARRVCDNKRVRLRRDFRKCIVPTVSVSD